MAIKSESLENLNLSTKIKSITDLKNLSESQIKSIISSISSEEFSSIIDNKFDLKYLLSLHYSNSLKRDLLNKLSIDKINSIIKNVSDLTYMYDLRRIVSIGIKDSIEREILNKISLDKISASVDSIYTLKSLLSLNCEESVKKILLNKVSFDKISASIDSIYTFKHLLYLHCDESMKTEILNKVSLDKVSASINSILDLKHLLHLNCDESIKQYLLSKVSTDKISASIVTIDKLKVLFELNCNEIIKEEILNKISIDRISASIDSIDALKILFQLKCDDSFKKDLLNKIFIDKFSDNINSIYSLESLLNLNCDESIKRNILSKISFKKGFPEIRTIIDLQILIQAQKYFNPETQHKINNYIDKGLNKKMNDFEEKDLCKKMFFSMLEKNINTVKKYVENLPKNKKMTVYRQLLSLEELDFFPEWREKNLLFRILRKVDPLFFDTFNLEGQILNLSDNIGNNPRKINWLKAAYGNTIKEYFNNDELSKKFMLSLKESSEQIVDFTYNEIDKDKIITNIKKSIDKLDNDEISFIMTHCPAGKIHNIPQVLMKVPSGPLKDKYLMLFINFGAGSNSSVLYGSGTVTMFVLNSNSKETLANQMFYNVNLANSVKITDIPEQNLLNFARESIHGFYKSNYQAFSKETIDNIKRAYSSETLNTYNLKNLGISLDFGNKRKGAGIYNCYVKQELVALEFVHSFLRTCENNKSDIKFDPISYLRNNSNKLSKNDNLKYTHLGPLSLNKADGLNSLEFKKLLIQKVNQLTENGVKLGSQISRLSSHETHQIVQELSQRSKLVKPQKPFTLSL